MDGGVRCLSLLADELGEEQVMQVTVQSLAAGSATAIRLVLNKPKGGGSSADLLSSAALCKPPLQRSHSSSKHGSLSSGYLVC